MQGTRNKKNTINGIPLLNRWSNGKNQPRGQSILTTLCQLSARQLDRMVIGSGILVQ